MSMNYDDEHTTGSSLNSDGGAFAPTPVWDRNRKRRAGFGRSAAPSSPVAPEPRSFAAPQDAAPPMSREREETRADQSAAYALGPAAVGASAAAAEPVPETAFAAPPPRTAARTTSAKSRGMGSTAIAGAAVGVLALGAVGWFATRDNGGVPELTPGAATTSEVAAAPLPPLEPAPAAPTAGERAANILPERATADAAPTRVARAETPAPVRAARTRPAATAADAQGVAASASVALPGGPQPYSSLNPGAVTTSVNPAPAPAVDTAPAAIPSTPPTLTPDPSTATAPAETTTAEPPQ